MKLINSITSYPSAIGGTGYILLMLATTVDVIGRKYFGFNILGIVEYGELLLGISVVLGLADSEYSGTSVKTNLVTNLLGTKARFYFTLPAKAICFLTTILLAYATVIGAYSSYEIDEMNFGSVIVYLWPVKVVIAASFISVLIIYIKLNVKSK